jgi:Beta-lactamase enzyme family
MNGSLRRRGRLAVAVLLATGACVVGASSARADVPGPITTRVMNILNATGSGTTGMYVKEVGGPVIAAQNENFAFGPASSIKVLLHLYAHAQVQAGAAAFGDQVTLYAGLATDCPNGAMVIGTEDLIDSAEKMMEDSDNPATRAQYEHWQPAPTTVNNYATSVGLTQTQFMNFIGCNFGQPALDGNTATLTDLGIIYEGVDDGSLISGTFRDSFYANMSGREQEEDPNDSDFTGIWPILLSMSNAEKPAGMPNSLLQDFQDGMTAHHKGGSYRTCNTMGCARTQWLSWAGSAVFPTCESNAFTSRSYVWGAFIHGSLDPNYNGTASPADTAFFAVRAEPLREQLNAALAGWGACYPPDVTVTTTPAAPPPGQDGYFNAADLAANGGGITVNVSATDDSGVTDLVCTDNGNPVAVLNQSGSNPRTGSFLLTSDGTHNVECEATDGMTPANTGASDDSDNTVTVKIDGTPPTVTCQAPPPVFVLNGPGGSVSATVTDATSGPVTSPISGPAIVTSAGAKTIDLTGEDKAGNTTTEACAYIVAYKFLGFREPLPAEHRKAGSVIPVKFRLGDANDVPIPDAEAAALTAACEVQVFFSGGDPSPNCADYKAGPNEFMFLLDTPKGVTGPHVITIKVFDGVVVINEEDSNPIVMT